MSGCRLAGAADGLAASASAGSYPEEPALELALEPFDVAGMLPRLLVGGGVRGRGSGPSGWPPRGREAGPERRAANLPTQGLPPIRLTISSWERPCCISHALSRSISTGSGRSRDASSASPGSLRVCSTSTTCCLLYCCMAITKPLVSAPTPSWRMPEAGGGPWKWIASCDHPRSEPNRSSLDHETLCLRGPDLDQASDRLVTCPGRTP